LGGEQQMIGNTSTQAQRTILSTEITEEHSMKSQQNLTNFTLDSTLTLGENTMNTKLLPTEKTMLSTEIVKIINDMREEGAAELRHDHFMTKVEKVLGEDAPKFRGIYKDKYGREKPCYALPKREAELMVMSENYKVQAAVYDRMTELEHQVIKPKLKPTSFLPQIAKEFRGALSITKMLGLSGNQAVLHADGALQKTTGHSVIKLFDIELLSPAQERHFNVTTLAEMIGFKSAIALNNELAAKGFQVKVDKVWTLTEKGKPFAVLLDKNKAHTHGTVQQLEWRESIKHELSKINA
jgi:hypothetical protein